MDHFYSAFEWFSFFFATLFWTLKPGVGILDTPNQYPHPFELPATLYRRMDGVCAFV
jgi:hypothetical protein